MKILTSFLESKIELSISSKPTHRTMETLTLPFSSSLKDTFFHHIINAARKAIPSGLLKQLTINIAFAILFPLVSYLRKTHSAKCPWKGDLMSNQSAKVSVVMIIKLSNCGHIIATDPKLLEKDFPMLYNLCKMETSTLFKRRKSPLTISTKSLIPFVIEWIVNTD